MLVYRKAAADTATAGATLTLATTGRILALAAGDVSSPGVEIGGDPQVLQQLVSVLDKPDPAFNIITRSRGADLSHHDLELTSVTVPSWRTPTPEPGRRYSWSTACA